jgi:hypothetical protein
MPEKISCPSCGKEVAIHLAVCPFCGKTVRSREEIENDPAVKERIARMAVDRVRSERGRRPGSRIRVTGPATAFLYEFMPRHQSGPMFWIERVLAVLSIPFLAFNCLVMTVLVKKWGRVPFVDIAVTALLAGIFTYYMENSLYFNVLSTSFVSLLLKKIVGLSAETETQETGL